MKKFHQILKEFTPAKNNPRKNQGRSNKTGTGLTKQEFRTKRTF